MIGLAKQTLLLLTLPMTHSQGQPREVDRYSDEMLVEQVVANRSRRHFQALVSRYQHKIHALVVSILGPYSAMEAEDVTQEVFIKLYTGLSRFKGECLFSTWLYRVTWNHALDAQRRAARLHGNVVDLRDIPEPHAETQRDPWEAAQNQTRLDRLIERLPESQKIAVRLHYWLGYELREIAELLACSENTVKSYLFRARRTLAAQLERNNE